MKRLGWAVCAAVVALAPAANAKNYGDAGCGLGSLIIHSNHHQSTAATSNGTLFNQSFGISFGTSNCNDSAMAKADAMQSSFVSLNMSNLQRDTAAGGGEYLATWSLMLGCDTTVQSAFFTVAQTKHDLIFAPKVSADDVIENFKTVVGADATLAPHCHM